MVIILAGRMVLPFEPLAMTFTDVQYYVDTPPVKKIIHDNHKMKFLCLKNVVILVSGNAKTWQST